MNLPYSTDKGIKIVCVVLIFRKLNPRIKFNTFLRFVVATLCEFSPGAMAVKVIEYMDEVPERSCQGDNEGPPVKIEQSEAKTSDGEAPRRKKPRKAKAVLKPSNAESPVGFRPLCLD